jgi:hypothetical protein
MNLRSRREAMASLIEHSSGLIMTRVEPPLPRRVYYKCFAPCCEHCEDCHHYQSCEEYRAGICSLKGTVIIDAASDLG